MITDLRMPKLDGMKLIEEIQTRRLPVTVIVTTGHGSIDEAVQAMRMGAYDFLTKPPDPQHLCLLVERALRERTLQDELAALRPQIGERHAFWNILSKCPRMFDIFELIGHIAETTTTVLIEGETGTGKEQVAQAIHQASATHRHGPFVAVHCAALPETLLESELFGHEKGAFTGAAAQRKGRFELAHGGTLFLDEVGDIPMAMQVKLLRVLQERRFERVGGNQSDRGRRPRHRGDQPQPGGDGQGREVPGGPLLSPERRQDRPPPSAQAARGHPAAGHLLRPEVRPAGPERPTRSPRRRWSGCWPTPGRATSASSRTPWSGPA